MIKKIPIGRIMTFLLRIWNEEDVIRAIVDGRMAEIFKGEIEKLFKMTNKLRM
ncbi:MAG: hypothetical protein ACRCR9_02200 [Chitinophagaceae bacterium]